MDADLLQVLLEHAEQMTWHVETDNLTIRLRALTGDPYATPDVAWEAAKALLDSITGLGHEIYGQSQVGVISEYDMGGHTDSTVSMPITGWRGRVELWFATQPVSG